MYYSDNNDFFRNKDVKDTKKETCMNMDYGKAYVLSQKYDNLVNIKYVFDTGTIFKDLICPYKEKKID
ncbi:MAG: hypothetical protein E7213_03445 [Clostridium sp.]|nr:hypothetical protein [Clostridium sp.]